MKLYLDPTRTTLIYSGKCVAKPEYVTLSNGETKRSGNQATNDAGMPLWAMDVFPDDDETMRAEALAVTVAAWEEPQAPKFQPIHFVNLSANVYVDSRSNRAAVSLKADGIDNGHQKSADKAA